MAAIFARRLGAALAVFAVLALAAILPRSETVDIAPPEPSPAEILADLHGCWTGAAPADMQGKLPGHVVMILPDGSTVYSTDVSRAMAHIFTHPEAGLTVYAFCR